MLFGNSGWRRLSACATTVVFTLTPAFAQYDLLRKGGHVIDGRNRISEVRDVAIANGRIAAVAANISPADALKVVDKYERLLAIVGPRVRTGGGELRVVHVLGRSRPGEGRLAASRQCPRLELAGR